MPLVPGLYDRPITLGLLDELAQLTHALKSITRDDRLARKRVNQLIERLTLHWTRPGDANMTSSPTSRPVA